MRRVAVATVVLLAALGAALLYWRQPATRPTAASPSPLPPATLASKLPPASTPVTAPARAPAGGVELKPTLKRELKPGVEPAPEAPATKDNPALFGKLVNLGQQFSLAEGLAKNAAAADRYLDRLCEETRKLREKPVMPDAPGKDRDAADFLAPLIDYEPPLDKPVGLLHLADDLTLRLTEYRSDWPLRISDRDLSGLDFSWMAQLAQFDHWSMLAAGRLRDVPPDNVFRDPIPNYLPLQQWAKLRLALGLRRGDALAASREVRHLADLMRTQGTLIGEMIALAIYGIDAHARTFAAQAALPVDGWPVLDRDQQARHRAAAFASIYFAYPGVKEETLRKAMDCTPAPCTALVEGAAAHRSFGTYGATDNLSTIRELAKSRGCESALLDRVTASRELPAGDALDSSEGFEGQIARFLGPK